MCFFLIFSKFSIYSPSTRMFCFDLRLSLTFLVWNLILGYALGVLALIALLKWANLQARFCFFRLFYLVLRCCFFIFLLWLLIAFSEFWRLSFMAKKSIISLFSFWNFSFSLWLWSFSFSFIISCLFICIYVCSALSFVRFINVWT